VTAEEPGTANIATRVSPADVPCKPSLHNETNRLRKQAVKYWKVCFGVHSKAEGL